MFHLGNRLPFLAPVALAAVGIFNSGTAHAASPPYDFNAVTRGECVYLSWQDNLSNVYDGDHVIIQEEGSSAFREFDLTNGQDVFTNCDLSPRTTYVVKVQTCNKSLVPFAPDQCSSWPTLTVSTKINWLGDGDFEGWTSSSFNAPWHFEGNAGHGVDIGRGNARSGGNNAWIRTSSTGWSAITRDVVTRPNSQYVLGGWIRTSDNVRDAYFGVRDINGKLPNQEVKLGPIQFNYRHVEVSFTATDYATRVFAGFWGPGSDAWIQIDDLWVTSAEGSTVN